MSSLSRPIRAEDFALFRESRPVISQSEVTAFSWVLGVMIGVLVFRIVQDMLISFYWVLGRLLIAVGVASSVYLGRYIALATTRYNYPPMSCKRL